MQFPEGMPEDAEFVVHTDEEADNACREYIYDSIEYFNASFLSKYMDLDMEAIETLQKSSVRDLGKIFHKLIGAFDDFVEEAINTEGRGHFLASYDFEENEVEVNGTTYYIYRTN